MTKRSDSEFYFILNICSKKIKNNNINLYRILKYFTYKKKNPNLTQVPTAPSFRLKGNGWYETDFKTGNKKNIAKSDNEKPAESKVPKEDKKDKSEKKKTTEKASS